MMLKYYNRIYKYALSMFLAMTFTMEWQMIILNSKSKYTEGVAYISYTLNNNSSQASPSPTVELLGYISSTTVCLSQVWV